MMESNVLITGKGPLTNEIVKNLALAGIGTLSIAENYNCDFDDIVEGTHDKFNCDGVSIIGSSSSLAEYAREINPQIAVRLIFKCCV